MICLNRAAGNIYAEVPFPPHQSPPESSCYKKVKIKFSIVSHSFTLRIQAKKCDFVRR